MHGVHILDCRPLWFRVGLALALLLLFKTPSSASEPPVISFFNPSIGSVGTSVTITGENFIGVQSVKFNETTVTNLSVVGNQIGVNVPSGATTGPITVVTVGGSFTSRDLFLVQQTGIPDITSFTPTSGTVGTVVTISGEHFGGVTGVYFGETLATAYTLVGSQISVSVPTNAVTGPISIVSASGKGVSAIPFEVQKGSPPVVGEFFPTSGPVGTLLTISGTHFVGVTSVKIGGVEVSGFTLIGSQISASVPAGAKSGPISVTTGIGVGVSAGQFFLTDVPAPSIASFAPANGPSGTRVTVTGSFFKDASAVTFDGRPASFLVFGNQIFATVPDGAASGLIRVTTPSGTAVSSGTFTVTSSTIPKITSFTPTNGPAGTVITIQGENLFDVTSVRVGGVDAAFNLAANPNITVTVPVNAVTGVLTIVAAGGTASSAVPFVLSAATAPQILSFSPESGPAGSIVILSGANLQNATAVRIGEMEASFFEFGGQIVVTLPAQATTGFLFVTTPAGTGRSERPFVIGASSPTILEFLPTKAVAGERVTVVGANLAGVSQVSVGDADAVVELVSGSEVRFVVPVGARTGAIRLTTATGTVSTSALLSVIPNIKGFVPSSGSAKDTILIEGTGFDGVSRVTFNGMDAIYEKVSSTQLRVQVPDQGSSGRIVVTTADGSARSGTDFSYIVNTPLEPPRIGILVLPNGRVQVSWANTNPAFTLQFTSGLGGVWATEPTQPLVTDGIRQVVLDPSVVESRFFRLTSVR